jgi:hypothetical protein
MSTPHADVLILLNRKIFFMFLSKRRIILYCNIAFDVNSTFTSPLNDVATGAQISYGK